MKGFLAMGLWGSLAIICFSGLVAMVLPFLLVGVEPGAYGYFGLAFTLFWRLFVLGALVFGFIISLVKIIKP